MKIRTKLILGFFTIAVFITVVGFISVSVSQKILQQLIQGDYIALADNMLKQTDKAVYLRIEQLQVYAQDLANESVLTGSNQEFEKFDNIQEYINKKDQAWKANGTGHANTFMEDLISNELSKKIREEFELKSFYKERYGYEVFGEVFVTNKYGANAAQTGATSDYNQADEQWWQYAKENGLYIGDVEYDQSAGIYSIAIGARVNGADGEFTGVVKAALNIAEVVNIIETEAEEEEHGDLGFMLLTADGRNIYCTEEFETLGSISAELAALLHEKDGTGHITPSFITGGDKPGEGKELYSYAHSPGYENYKGLGWTLVLENETDEIFAPVAKLRNWILIVSLVITMLATAVGIIIYRSIAVPIGRLTEAAAEIGQGNLDKRVLCDSNDEIGLLADSFNAMLANLSKTTTSRKELLKEIDIRKKTEKNLEIIFTAAPFGLLLLDENLIVRKSNHVALKLVGRETSEILNGKVGDGLGCINAHESIDGCGHSSMCSQCVLRNTVEEVLSSGQTVKGTELQHTFVIDGNEVTPWLEVTIEPISIDNHKHVLVAISNITERKRVEENLKKSEERFHDAALNAGEWIWETDEEGRYTYSSPAVENILGYKPEEMLKKYFYDSFHPDKKEEYKKGAMEVFSRKDSFRGFLNQNIHRDGHVVILETSGTPLIGKNGKLLGYRGVDRDITDRMRAEKELWDSEQRARAYFEHSPVCTKIVDLDFNLQYMSHAGVAALKVDGAKEFYGKPYPFDFFPESFKKSMRKCLEKVKKTGEITTHEGSIVNMEGSELWFQSTLAPVNDDHGQLDYIIVVSTEITERKNAEKERVSLAKFPSENPNPVLRIAEDGKVLYSNKAGEQLLNKWQSDIGETVPDKWCGLITKSLACGKVREEDEEVKDNIFSITITPIKEAGYVNLYARDITDLLKKQEELASYQIKLELQNAELRDAQAKIEESRQKYSDLYDFAPMGYFTFDKKSQIISVNTMGSLMLGVEKDSLIEKPFYRYIAKGYQDNFYLHQNKVFETEEEQTCELKLLNNDGKEFYVQLQGKSVHADKGNINQCRTAVIDISERKQAEEEKRKLEAQLRQTQKMEAVGTLAGGIAHDFNNILGALIGYTVLAKEDVPEGTLAHQNLQEVLISANRAKELVKQILTFSRKDDAELVPVHINTIVQEVLKLLHSSLPATIEINQDINCNSSIVGDETHIHQVLMNLGTNAAHAMEENGGVLEVSLSDVIIESDIMTRDGNLQPGSYVKLSVKDNGCGMSKEVMERIFEPFYTTKEIGKGTGMGLSVVHGIIENHNGIITVDSTPGEGTTFNVFFPCVEDTEIIETEDSEIAFGQGEQILFVDDEKSLVDMTTQMLKRIGYEVVGKTNSTEALKVFQEDPGKFDLVITDQTMGKMTGTELAKQLLSIRPDIPIILCTGYRNSVDPESAKAVGIKKFIVKPVNREEISQIIREILDKKVVAV